MARRVARRAPEVSRGEILDAALACFSARGYHETSVDDIAERAGLSKGAIYWHFAGKRELFLALLDRAVEPGLALATTVAEAPDWRAALHELFTRVPKQVEEGMPLLKLALDFIKLGADDPGIRVRAEQKQEVWNAAVQAQLARGVAAGKLRPVAAHDVMLVIGATISGLMLHKLMRPELDLEAAWRAAEEIFWRGLEA
jgi:AcrR family transcriptional regulator